MTQIALQKRLPDIVAEYREKVEQVPAAIEMFEQAGKALMSSASVAGAYGRTQIDTGRVCQRNLLNSLLKSAWWHVYEGLNIKAIAPANDKRRFEKEMENPPEFNMHNLRATFGDYILDPRGNILRGLAEVFTFKREKPLKGFEDG